MLKTIHLHGRMRKQFGGPFDLRVRTPAEALHALNVQLPGFADAIRDRHWRVVRGPLKGGRTIPVDQLNVNLDREMHLVAAPAGSGGRGGTGKIVIGAVLLVVAAVLTWGASIPASAGIVGAEGAAVAGAAAVEGTVAAVGGGLAVAAPAAAAGTVFGISAGQIALFGASMLFGGISQALASNPKAQGSTNQDIRRSFLFNGTINAEEQGVCIPIALGRIRTGGIKIATSLETTDIQVDGSTTPGLVDQDSVLRSL